MPLKDWNLSASVWICLVWYGGGIPRRVYHRWGWNSNMMHHRRMMLRRRAADAVR